MKPGTDMDKSQRNEMIDLMTTRSSTYRLLSRLWGWEVDERLWAELRGVSFPSLPELPALDAGYRQLEAYLRRDDDGVIEDLAADYAVLCLGARRDDGADPYGSVHLSEEGIMMQDEWEEMLYLYAELGLQRAKTTVEPEDHLALELECMAYLCQRAADALQNGEDVDVPGTIQRQISLLDDHLLRWVPAFVEKVHKLASTDFYRAVGTITQEYLALDRAILADLDAVEMPACSA